MNLKIWKRYLVWQFIKTFLLFIFCFYGLYVLVDYASHSRSLHTNKAGFEWYQFCMYYTCDLIIRMDVLIPFALLIATVRTLTSITMNNELLALMAGGLELKRIMRPFIYACLFFTAVLYLNHQFFVPKALSKLRLMTDLKKIEKNKNNNLTFVQSVVLDDHTILLYQSYNSAERSFFDVYWIRSVDDIYRIKKLFPYNEVPIGYYVDQLKRNKEGNLTVVSSFEEYTFPDIKFTEKILLETINSPEYQSLTNLWRQLPSFSKYPTEKESMTGTMFFLRMTMPWLCLFAFLAPAPFCIRFSRNPPLFLIYSCSIFGLVAVYLVFDAGAILGNRQVLSPAYAILLPFICLVSYFTWNYRRLSTN